MSRAAARPEGASHWQDQLLQLKRFARDVGVNVVANLLAAAIIYLLGAAAGLLPRSPYLIATAVSAVGLSGGVALPVFVVALRGHRRFYAASAAFVFTGLGFVAASFTGTGFSLNPVRIGELVYGLLATTIGVLWFVDVRRSSPKKS